MMITNGGTLVRTRVSEVSQVGRNTQGVTLIRTSEGEKVVGLQRIDEPDEEILPLEDGEESTAEVTTEATTDTPVEAKPESSEDSAKEDDSEE